MEDGTNKFNPEDEALREDVTMGIVKAKGLENSEYDINTLNSFSDLDSIAGNRRKYVAIAVENGLMNGNANGTFNPKGALTRAEGATVIKKLLSTDVGNYKDLEISEIAPCIYDQVSSFSEGLVKVEKDGKCGYVNEDGKEIIPYVYDNAGFFSEGIACVKENDKHSYIDKLGNKIMTFDYIVEDFHDGMARILKNEKIGYINKNGEEVIPCIYDWGGVFSESAVIMRNNKYGVINKNGDEILPCVYEGMKDFEEGFGDTNGFNFSQDFLCIIKNGQYGLINKYGTEVLPCVYEEIQHLSEGTVSVKKAGKYGFVRI